MANSADLDEVAHYEPPHQDLCCLRIIVKVPIQILREGRNVNHLGDQLFSVSTVLFHEKSASTKLE